MGSLGKMVKLLLGEQFLQLLEEGFFSTILSKTMSINQEFNSIEDVHLDNDDLDTIYTISFNLECLGMGEDECLFDFNLGLLHTPENK
jgi:hypothetical protein